MKHPVPQRLCVRLPEDDLVHGIGYTKDDLMWVTFCGLGPLLASLGEVDDDAPNCIACIAALES